MRTNTILLDSFEDIKILQQFLYMSDEHTITVKNNFDVDIIIRLDDNLHYYSKNTQFPDVPEMDVSQTMTIPTILSLIEQLKQQPIQILKTKENRWEEIKALCRTNVAHNEIQRSRL